MKIKHTALPGVVILEPRVFADSRGFFMESFNQQKFRDLGLPENYVQDNQSRSVCGTVRGLHYQLMHPQGKLVRAISGAIFDVAVDLRRHSPTFGRSIGTVLSAENRRQMYIPPGFAHGFCALTAHSEIIYKCTDLYHPEDEQTLLWNDPTLDIDWPITDPILSEKDATGRPFAECPYFEAATATVLPSGELAAI